VGLIQRQFLKVCVEKQSRVPIIFVLETKINVSDSRSGRLAHVKKHQFHAEYEIGPQSRSGIFGEEESLLFGW
jgi:hypothetical protein